MPRSKLNSNVDRLAANHHHGREEGSPIMVRPRRFRRQISHKVQADTFRPVPRAIQATIAYQAVRPGEVSLKVGAKSIASRSGASAIRADRGQPQARIATERDRREIPGMVHPTGHGDIGRSVISPNLLNLNAWNGG